MPALLTFVHASLYLVLLPVMSRILKGLILFLARYILRDPVMAGIVSAIGPKDTSTFFSWMHQMNLFNKQFEKDVWEAMDLDSIVW